MKSFPIEAPIVTPRTTITMLGGIIVARAPPHPSSDALKAGRYFSSFIAGSIIEPIAATSATPEPDIAPKNMQETTMTIAMPPRMCPTMLEAKRIMRGVMSPSAIRAPASRKSGMASSVKESAPTTMRCAITSQGSVAS